jgi:hypothetical protein
MGKGSQTLMAINLKQEMIRILHEEGKLSD